VKNMQPASATADAKTSLLCAFVMVFPLDMPAA